MAITLIVKKNKKSKSKNTKPKVSDVMNEIQLFSFENQEIHDPLDVVDQWGNPVHGWKLLQILSVVVLPDDPNDNPHDYFDGSEELVQGLREGRIHGTPAEFWARGKEREFLDYLYAKYPKVKHA